MQAFRGGLTRVAGGSGSGSSLQQQTRLFASKKGGPRLSWRQKAKLEEAKRNPTPPRQPPRGKVTRQNFLVTPAVDDGKKWRILSAGILERLPVIQPDLKDWEQDFERMEHEKALREDQRLEDDFWFMEPGTRHITPEEAAWPDVPEPEDEDLLVGAGFPLAPRETEADASDDRKSLDRALKGRVFLLLKNEQGAAKFPWFFPVGEKLEAEKMRDAALRHVTEAVGEDLEATPVGFAPVGYVQYLHEAGSDDEFDGTKIFLYKSQLLEGDVELNTAKASDYLWVTQSELSEYLDPEIAAYVKKVVPP